MGQIYNILFDHDYAFEELYCIVFQLLDRTWDEMNAAYMDFPKVLSAGLFSLFSIVNKLISNLNYLFFIVKEKVSVELKINDRIANFQRSCSKVNPIEVKSRNDPIAENEQFLLPLADVDKNLLKLVARETREEMMALAIEHKKQLIKQGAVFKEFLKKGKHNAQSYIYMICTYDEKELKWERVAEANIVPDKFTNTS